MKIQTKVNSESSSPSWMDNDRPVRRAGYTVLLLFVFGVGAWAVFAPLESAAIAAGIVQVEGKRKLVQHLEGGIVAEIAVANGDSVEQGQPLILLDATKDRAEKQILRGRIFNTQALVDRLQAERDDLLSVAFSSPLIDTAALDQRAQNAMDNETSLFSVRMADRLGEESVVQSSISGASELARSKGIIVDSLEEEIADLKILLADGYVDKQRLRQLERTKNQTLGELSDLDVAMREGQLKVLQIRKRFKTQVVDSLTEAREKLYDLEQQYEAVADRVARATIRSPVQGTVLHVEINTIGAVVTPGQTLMEIVPDVDKLVIEARVSPMDIDRVEVGQTAEVRFSVFKDAYMVSGTLTKLSADRLVDQGSDLPYYSAEIRLLEEDLHLLRGMSLVPGMPAEVLIKTGERTMMRYLTSPLARITSRSLIED